MVNSPRSNLDNASTPRWVKVSGAIAIVFLIVFVGIHLAGGGFHHHHMSPMRPVSPMGNASNLPAPAEPAPAAATQP